MLKFITGFLPEPKTIFTDSIRSNANNNIFRIKIRTTLGKLTVPIWFQEYYEAMHKRENILALFRVSSVLREMELVGQEIEVQHHAMMVQLPPTETELYRSLQARALKNHYKQFKGMSETEIYQGMTRKSYEAKTFLQRNIGAENDMVAEAMRRGISV